jgi:uncharacterized repeat protein (TIGR04076 family)
MLGETLTPKEQKAIDFILGWAKSYKLVRTINQCKLMQVITNDNEQQYYTLVNDPEPRVIFHEPVRFIVTVKNAKGECRASHQPGDKWEFSWCTPAGMCGSAYHAMYPVLHGLMLTSGRYDGPAAQETLVACPDHGWLTFGIERHRWMPDDWDHFTKNLEENDI